MKKWSLQGKFVLIACVILALPLTVLSAILYSNSINEYRDLSLRAGNMTMEQAANQVERASAQAVETSLSLAGNARVLEHLTRAQGEYPLNERIDDIRELRSILGMYEVEGSLKSVRLVYPQSLLWISNNNFISVGYSSFTAMLAQNGIEMTDGFLQGVVWISGAEMMASDALFHYKTIICARMLRNPQNYDELLGYALVMQDPGIYEKLIDDAELIEGGYIFLSDTNHNLITDVGADGAQGIWKNYVSSGMPEDTYRDPSGDMLVLHRTLKTTGWRLTLLIPLSDHQRYAAQTGLRTAAIVLSLFIAALIIGHILLHSMLRRVNTLVDCMNGVSEGDLTARVQVCNEDELGQIETHYNAMLDRIAALVQSVRLGAQRERLQQIKLLQSQINPHFLYNTINSISWTARDYGADKVCRMLRALSDYYKIGLHPGREEASLADELLHAQRYVALQNMRGTPHTELTVHADEALMTVTVPNLLLQPLVENSIVHGFAGRDHGRIDLSVTREGDMIRIAVKDDGFGMRAEACAQLLEADNPEQSYGIYYISERLKLNYAGKASMVISPNEDGAGIEVVIRLPV